MKQGNERESANTICNEIYNAFVKDAKKFAQIDIASIKIKLQLLSMKYGQEIAPQNVINLDGGIAGRMFSVINEKLPQLAKQRNLDDEVEIATQQLAFSAARHYFLFDNIVRNLKNIKDAPDDNLIITTHQLIADELKCFEGHQKQKHYTASLSLEMVAAKLKAIDEALTNNVTANDIASLEEVMQFVPLCIAIMNPDEIEINQDAILSDATIDMIQSMYDAFELEQPEVQLRLENLDNNDNNKNEKIKETVAKKLGEALGAAKKDKNNDKIFEVLATELLGLSHELQSSLQKINDDFQYIQEDGQNVKSLRDNIIAFVLVLKKEGKTPDDVRCAFQILNIDSDQQCKNAFHGAAAAVFNVADKLQHKNTLTEELYEIRTAIQRVMDFIAMLLKKVYVNIEVGTSADSRINNFTEMLKKQQLDGPAGLNAR